MALFLGTEATETIVGTNDNDRFIMSLGNDMLFGGLGIDLYTNDHPDFGSYLAVQDLFIDMGQGTATATGFSQTFQGFENASYDAQANSSATYTTILGDGQNNKLSLDGYSGLLDGGAGNDTLTFSFISNGTMRGGAGDDTFTILDSRGGTLEGGDGSDTLRIADAQNGGVSISRNALDQLVLSWNGGQGADVTLLDKIEYFDINGENGREIIDYDSFLRPLQTVTGSDVGEVLLTTDKVETIDALDGKDWIIASRGNDHIDGGAGIDMLSYVNLYGVIINLGEERARIREEGFTSGGFRLTDTHQVINIENVTGTSGNDHIGGDAGANYLRGLGGYDKFIGSAGGDLINGGAGTDAFLDNTFLPESAMYVSLLRGRVWEGNGAGTRLQNIEHLIGGDLDDTLIGDHSANKLDGRQGDDTLMGNGGNDLIYGDLGTDTARFSFDQDQYQITQSNGVTEVAYIGAGDGDGTDRLLSIEILSFADGDVIL